MNTDSSAQPQGARLALLYRVSQTFNSSLDLDTVLNRVMDEVIAVTSAERGFVMLRDEASGQSGTDRGLYYYEWSGSTWSGCPCPWSDEPSRHVHCCSGIGIWRNHEPRPDRMSRLRQFLPRPGTSFPWGTGQGALSGMWALLPSTRS